MSQTKYCVNCGTPYLERDSFCTSCGFTLQKSSSQVEFSPSTTSTESKRVEFVASDHHSRQADELSTHDLNQRNSSASLIVGIAFICIGFFMALFLLVPVFRISIGDVGSSFGSLGGELGRLGGELGRLGGEFGSRIGDLGGSLGEMFGDIFGNFGHHMGQYGIYLGSFARILLVGIFLIVGACCIIYARKRNTGLS